MYCIGIDIGSTTIKGVILNRNKEVIYHKYKRHYSDIKKSLLEMLKDIKTNVDNSQTTLLITGSGAIEIAQKIGVKFVQEVIASTESINYYHKDTDVVIELGGEDAKITFLKGRLDQRMNGICAGGTGAFIDQMATLLKTDAKGLDELAKGYNIIYPIASRCGVFAKTDIQPLLNDGAQKEDIAMSILNAVAVQSVSVLACGRKIEGNVAFLGGPLSFLPQLRFAFKRLLNLKDDNIIFPENGKMYVAIGAALLSENEEKINLEEVITNLKKDITHNDSNFTYISPIFENEDEYTNFISRHEKNKVKNKDIKLYGEGNCYLGIDAGSTTTKLILINDKCEILYSFYDSNNGNPLETIKNALIDMLDILPEKCIIKSSLVTGYGEGLIKKALNIDFGEIETIAHYKGAKYFNKNVDFIIDIGGQDMKCLKIKNNVIDSILLNEACSAGCGSFIQTFANSLSMSVEEFAKCGRYSKSPVDLGTRCTVFMNSKIKQAQKEGAGVEDISSGLAYSVVKNALFKVIKLRDVSMLGDNIVVQGGTFYNDLVLRAFEKLTNKKVIRPQIAGMMGAFGAALLAKENQKKDKVSGILNKDEIRNLKLETNTTKCRGCSNNCLLTINKFDNNQSYISGNRCEKAEVLYNDKKTDKNKKMMNLYEYKYKRLFEYYNIKDKQVNYDDNNIKIGIPRVLNIYENYPFWYTFFSELEFEIILSDKSSKSIYEKGISSISSETACYPAKISHGHIQNLIEKEVDYIFYPSITNEIKEDFNASNNYNCPVVISYSEVIKNNIEELRNSKSVFLNPFLSLNNKSKLKTNLYECLSKYFNNITIGKIEKALEKAYKEQQNFKDDIKKEGIKIINQIDENNEKAIVLCGRPYHIDPEINHGIDKMINLLGMHVLTEDSVCDLCEDKNELRVVDQWVYHSRLYKAANYIKNNKNLELVQLNSFGCGIDAVTIDQVEEILNQNNKIYTVIKIDEGNNLGAAKIRLRSLKAAMVERDNTKNQFQSRNEPIKYRKGRINKNHTILVPQMSPIHFQFFEEALKLSGYKLEILNDESSNIIDEGLKYVNNDACYPALVVIGQIISALKSGKYDINNTSVAITQTGGGCRDTNYICFLRKALYDAGFKQIPVISLSVNGVEKNGLIEHISYKMLNRILMSCIYGDLLMKVLYKVRPYEAFKGSSDKLYDLWVERCKLSLINPSMKKFKNNIKDIIKDFDDLEIRNIKKPKVGLVGEILVKFHPVANNNLVKIIENEGAEAVVPELSNFLYSCALNSIYKYKYLEGKWINKEMSKLAIDVMEFYQKSYKKYLNESKRFKSSKSVKEIANSTKKVISLGNQTGEGWLLTGEMIELIEEGVNNIVCMQPFGCLPNHITGKGQMKELKRRYNKANIVAIDYDPSASETNQINRLKLMLSTAFKNNE